MVCPEDVDVNIVFLYQLRGYRICFVVRGSKGLSKNKLNDGALRFGSGWPEDEMRNR